jgi:outer membrane protein assembly factor BamD
MRAFTPLALALSFGCATFGGGDDEEEEDIEAGEDYLVATGRNESLPSVSYGQTAQDNWDRGERAFTEEEYLAAQRYYAYIRNKFPYSRFAVLADLRIGDCQFERERYIEAIDTYQNFVRLHPTHPKVGYARYKTGMAYYEQIPGDWFLLPPSHEKDQAAVRDAERALREYVERYPSDENIQKASEILRDVRSRLMAHERYAADFYKNLDRDRAYVGRLEVIRKDFADVGLTDELLLEIAEVYSRLGEVEKTKTAVAEMREKFPASELIAEAQELITSTNGTGTSTIGSR